MAFCTTCGKSIDDNTKFCPYCGATVEGQAAPVQQTPVYYGEPVYNPPAVSGGTKALGIVGMILGIESLVTGIAGLWLTIAMVFAAAEAYDYSYYSYYYDDYFAGMALGYGLTFGIIVLVSAIVAKVLCNKSANRGNTAGTCKAGSVTSTFGLILGILTMIAGFAALAFTF